MSAIGLKTSSHRNVPAATGSVQSALLWVVVCHCLAGAWTGTVPVGARLVFAQEIASADGAREIHVSTTGDDQHDGALNRPLRTIQCAANLARPGDTITVHEGVYRECICPTRGGVSDEQRIVYQAAPGERVVIKGSEIVKDWKQQGGDTWTVSIPNSYFGSFHPYRDRIEGDWFDPKNRTHHTGAVYLNGHWLVEAKSLDDVLQPIEAAQDEYVCDISGGLWFATVDPDQTTIYAQFKNVNPNHCEVEINVRQAVFYPRQCGVNYLTVRGFTMEHAATPWAPPTAEQVGLIGTHWSKGWIIENNVVRYSVCTGITLGKHGDEFDNTSADTAEGYVKTIRRAYEQFGWRKENIGHHVVRNNHISHCEQAGLVGSLGGAFSTISGNTIDNIHIRRLFGGAEMAGIKIHAPIDTVIHHNHIHRTCLGIWLDWMTQGTRVTGNLLHDNARDLFVEVNHGPFLVDNNIMLSPASLLVNSCGGAYAHNLIAGSVNVMHHETRETPYHVAHSTEVAGLHGNPSGDDRYYNNVFVHHNGLVEYDQATLPVAMQGNVFLNGARPSKHEADPEELPSVDPHLRLVCQEDTCYLEMTLADNWPHSRRPLATTALLGNAIVPNLRFEHADGAPYRLDTDYLGARRDEESPNAGPFEFTDGDRFHWTVWSQP